MQQPPLTDTFKRSYEAFESYPRTLICHTTKRDADAYVARLASAEPTLFEVDETQIEVPFRDLLPSKQGFQKQNICDDAHLKDWLGDTSIPSTVGGPPSGLLATKKDPLCRFIYFYAGHSRSPLRVNRQILLRILSYHQVMPGYIDFLLVFGFQDEPRDLRFSGFREQNLLNTPIRGPAVEMLGRSGRQFQLCYNLKAANCISLAQTKVEHKVWSIRQAAIHHQFDIETGTSLWIVTKGDKEIKDRIEDLNGPIGQPEDRDFSSPEECFRRTLGVHMVYCNWATEDWRWYIQWLEEVLDHGTEKVFAPRKQNRGCYVFEPREVQEVQSYEEKIHIAIMMLDGNINILRSLKRFYGHLMVSKNFPWKSECSDDIMEFTDKLSVMIYDLEMQTSRINLLVKISGDRKALASTSRVMQHIQAQGTEKMERMTESTHNLGIMAQKEAIAVRIITVVTVIFLPATFVSTFFSTDVIKYQNGGDFSMHALLGWLAVTIPLTIVTLGLCYFFFQRSTRRKLGLLGQFLTPRSHKETKE
ncbi:hypothetical protein BP5796_12760 [Coleophoma crateriformis]|uniref:CorA-like transporter domain-containing protein n=1 Tax=Coleophoma crateriformis TaxID=565419 RepID=A0A3D8Q6M1_9HELO|nr:hypothetical protein BP5796_12760 [Coleophoma crateriformis]